MSTPVSFSNESIHTGLYAAPFLFSRITLYIRRIISYPLLKLGAFGFRYWLYASPGSAVF